MRRLHLLPVAVLATVALATVATASGSPFAPVQRATPVVAVADDYFAPTEVKIRKNQRVKWRWDNFNTNPHNVTLTSTKPQGVKKKDFKSSTGAINLRFKRKFEKPGKYGFVCTIHRTVMTMTVKVTK